jgi:hypothetical protein
MKKLIIPALAGSMLLLSGCGKSSARTNGGAPVQVTDWGVVEVVGSTPKHLKLDGRDCTLTATPLANGDFAVYIESARGVTDTNSPAGVPSGTRVLTTQNMIVPGNVECICDIDRKPVRFTLKLKTS